MAKKQALTTKTAPETAAPAAAVKPRDAKPAAPRISSAKHSKSVAPDATPVISAIPENRHEAISKLAYGYWIARGFQDGSPHEDWLRAEREYLSKQQL